MYRCPTLNGEQGAAWCLRRTFRLEAGMLSFGSKVTEKKGLRLMNGDEYLDRRETILYLYAILHL